VLSSDPDPEQLHLVLAAILILPGYFEPTPASIEFLLELPYREVVSKLPRVFPIFKMGGWEDAISLHLLFKDFFVDEKRAGSFHVEYPEYRRTMVTPTPLN
jgi:hypothetical protein